jgi:hypothetical protein
MEPMQFALLLYGQPILLIYYFYLITRITCSIILGGPLRRDSFFFVRYSD